MPFAFNDTLLGLHIIIFLSNFNFDAEDTTKQKMHVSIFTLIEKIDANPYTKPA